MFRRPIGGRSRILLAAGAMGSLLLGYTGLSYWQHQKTPNDTTIPTWRQLAHGVVKCVRPSSAELQRWIDNPGLERPKSWLRADAEATATRLFMGIGIGVAVSVILGLAMGCSRVAEAFLLPPIAFLAKVPPTAALAVFFVLVGTNLKMFTAMIVFGTVPTMTQTVYFAARDVSDEYFHKGFSLGSRNWDAVWLIMFPFVLPKLLDAIRLVIGPAVVYLIAAEMLCSNVGFGYRIRLQARLLDMSVVYPYLFLLAAFTFAMDLGLRFLQRKVCRWYLPEEGGRV